MDNKYRSLPVRECRDIILSLSTPLAELCNAVMSNSDPIIPLSSLFTGLLCLSKRSGLSLKNAITQKLFLNAKKYPVSLCKGSTTKYTEYSEHTGITRFTGQSITSTVSETIDEEASDCKIETWWTDAVLLIETFRDERDWGKYDSPRNLCLAISGEFGELASVLQFESDDSNVVQLQTIGDLMQEMADVSIYSIRLALGLELRETSPDNVVFIRPVDLMMNLISEKILSTKH